jgi:hypothetical protein
MSEIQKQVADNEIISKEALQMSNYNQQYSRKFNIKIMNYPEKKDEKIRDIFVKDIVKDKLNVALSSSLQFLSLVISPILCFVTSSTSLTVSFFGKFFLALIILYFTSEQQQNC